MDYITQLHRREKVAVARIGALEQGIEDLIEYLSLPKFHDDTTVQVSDVIRRLRETKSSASEAAVDTLELEGWK